MKVLFIGGTGIISSACTALAAARGHEVTLLNRGQSSRPVPAGVRVLAADVRDPAAFAHAVEGQWFDAVVDFISFVPSQVETALEALAGRTGQYVFISSASAYRKPPAAMPIVESHRLHNPHWEYSRNKIACEEYLWKAWDQGWPVTVVRPSHTYDRTLLPMDGGWYVAQRMLDHQEVIVHGDGTSLWTLTHHRDFAVGLLGLLGHPQALGEAFHITGDEWLSWDQIFGLVGQALGVAPQIVHVPSDIIARFNPDWGAGLLGDKALTTIFDNSKVRRLVPDFRPAIPFHQGIREVVAWYREDPARQTRDHDFARRYEEILAWVHH